MILVTGAGGTVGTAVLAELRAAGHAPRAAYHTREKTERAKSAGHDAVTLDFGQPQTLKPALAGVETVFLLGTGGMGQTEGETNVVNAAKAAGVAKIVKLSVWGAAGEEFSFARIHRAVERVIEASGLAWTHLRPNGFMQNFVNYQAGSIKAQNAFYAPAGEARISHIDARDIGRVAAQVLTASGHESRAYELSGPQALSYADAAEILSRVVGRKVGYVAVTDEAAKAGMLAGGIPEFYADYLIDLNQAYRRGLGDKVTTAVQDVTGRAPVAFEQFAQENAAAF